MGEGGGRAVGDEWRTLNDAQGLLWNMHATVTCDDNTRNRYYNTFCLWKLHVNLLLLKLSIRQPGCSSVLIICFIFLFVHAYIDIFYFLQSDWLQERAAFYDLDRSPKSYF